MLKTDLVKNINDGKYDKRFIDIYVDETQLEYQKERYVRAVEKFSELFDSEEIEIFSAPGRSEVCGNHTDHQRGKVLATSINQDTIAIVSKKNDNKIVIAPEGYEVVEVDLDDTDLSLDEKGTTKSLVKGVIRGLVDEGYMVSGFVAYTTSDVLIGAGLSSSAAYEVLIGSIISGLFNDMKIDSVEIAKISQFAENIYFGKPCGLMDQMACSVGGLVYIDFENPTSPIVERVNVDFAKYGYSLCIVDTLGSHADLTDDYAAIPKEMKMVAKFFEKDVLREVDEDEFEKQIIEMRKILSDRAILRAMHFFTEEKNVENAVSYLKNDDILGFLSIIKKSGDSSFKYLQNVYTNKNVDAQNIPIALSVSEKALGDNGVCRVHGGGFAGTIQVFVKNEFVDDYKEKIERVLGKDTCKVLKIRSYGGIKF